MSDSTDIVALLDEVTQRSLRESGRHGGVASPEVSAHETGIGSAAAAAAQHSHMGTVLGPGARFGLAKRALLRVTRLITRDQVAYNAAVVEALQSAEQQVLRLQALIATADVNREVGAERITRDADAVRAAVREMARQREADRAELQLQRARVSLFLQEARGLPASDGSPASQPRFHEDADDAGALYSHLEERFRGSRDDIRVRQTIYLQDVLPLRERGLPLLDIGPGRGEWLDLMREHEFPAYGVDTNALFVETAKKDGLDVRHGDGIAHLGDVDEDSLAAVTAFQVVEHIPFDSLRRLLDGALHALIPGGLLLLETPNPANVSVGSNSFWLDPTHLRPIPADLLQFVLQDHGFVDVEVRFPAWGEDERLASLAAVENDDLRTLTELLKQDFFGPKDYAVLARKPAPA
jgi:O-antigen chain-terminating methyltransferase